MEPQSSSQTPQPAREPAENDQTETQAPAEPAASTAAAAATSPPHSRLKPFIILGLSIIILAGLGVALHQALKPAQSHTAVATKKDIPKLSVGVINGTIALYPQGTADSYAGSINAQIYEGLVRYSNQTKIQPLLAAGWSNPNNSTWDFDLRHNVTFHNGHTMTAADVVYSINFARQNQDLNSTFTNTITSAKALNSYKVEITTQQPDPFLLNKLNYVMVLDAKAPNATDTMNGTGAYELKAGTKPTDSTISLVAYDHYHGGHVYTRALDYRSETSEAASSTDYKKGVINMAGEYVSKDKSSLHGVHYVSNKVDDTTVSFLHLDTVSPGPLQNEKVREALRDSLDLTAIIKAAGRDGSPATQLMTQAIPGYNPSLPVPKQDIVKAKSLLAEAGYSKGVSLTLETSQDAIATNTAVAKQAAAAGFTITLKTASDFKQLINDSLGLNGRIVEIGYSSDVLDGSDVLSSVLQSGDNYKSTTLDNYLTRAADTINQADRLKILQNASKYVYDTVAAIPLYHLNRTWITDQPYAIQFDSSANAPGAYFWQVYATK